MELTCRKCGKKDTKEELLHLHHIIPKCIGGTDSDGRKWLCQKCHQIIHNMIPKFMMWATPTEHKQTTKDYVKKQSEQWINKK